MKLFRSIFMAVVLISPTLAWGDVVKNRPPAALSESNQAVPQIVKELCVNGRGSIDCSKFLPGDWLSGAIPRTINCPDGITNTITIHELNQRIGRYCEELARPRSLSGDTEFTPLSDNTGIVSIPKNDADDADTKSTGASASAGKPEVKVTGTIVDDQGGLPGGSVCITDAPKNTDNCTESLDDGSFMLTVPQGTSSIDIQFVGYKTKTVPLSGSGSELNLGEITLELDTEMLDEVVVVADRCNDEDKKKLHAAEVKFSDEINICYPTKCESERYKLTRDDHYAKCEDQVGKNCRGDLENKQHVRKAVYEWDETAGKLVCVVTDCANGYVPNAEENATACKESDGPCPEDKLEKLDHATAGELQGTKCVATECEDGYEVEKGKCKPTDAEKAEKTQADAPEAILSEEDSLAQIEELQANADAMREKEQSFGNRMVGGTAMGTMGIGGQMIGSALAEQSADSDAEMDMAAYLATFKCDYGAGMNITGGTLNVELPGANILLPIYTEYVTLAADLKTRKEALGMAPGIESNEILDAATSGLYDNVSTGVTGGAYASIARALMNPEGADAAAWAAQKAETSEQLKAGAITAGVGALVGISGNVLLNEIGPNKVEERSDEIMSEYDKKRRIIREELKEVEEESLQQQITEAPDVEPIKIPEPESDTESTEEDIVVDTPPDSDLTDESDEESTPENTDESASTVTLATVYNQTVFESGSYTIKEASDLDKIIQTLNNPHDGFENNPATLYLIAHTDNNKIIQTSDLCAKEKICKNEQLSAKRAQSAADYIQANWKNKPENVNIISRGVGAQCAKVKTGSQEDKKMDRKVVFYLFYDNSESDQADLQKLQSDPCTTFSD